LNNLEPAQYAALCQLTGRPSRTARSMTINVAQLDTQLRAAGLASSLKEALERLDGPIIARASLRNALAAEWLAINASLETSTLLGAWLQNSRTSMQLLKRLAREPERAGRLLNAADAVLHQLPAQGLARAQLAAETLGDAHALDTGRPVATLVLAAWRHYERANAELEDEGTPGIGEIVEERAREVWSRAGVLVNELARPALFLNLPAAADSPCSWLPGEPGYLSLRQLLRQPCTWLIAGQPVFVCENPNIVAIAADHLGQESAPLVCTDGMPAAAQRILLDQLTDAGARLFYHGDFDWPGIGIGNHVMRTWRALPWRFGHDDYRMAVTAAATRPRDLSDNGVRASWDSQLWATMNAHGLTVPEEAVTKVLLRDLAGN
jgi:uncharacterized protein (TIGR02679 family)